MTFQKQKGLAYQSNYRRPRHLVEPAIVLESWLPDHPNNKTGVDVECDVILVATRQLLRNVPVMQKGSGVRSQWPRWIPTPSRLDLGDEEGGIEIFYRDGLQKVTRLDELDGEQVFIVYIRSNNTQPVIIGSLNHKSTGLVPRRRDGRLHNLVHQGASTGVDEEGSVFVDTTQSKGAGDSAVALRMEPGQPITVQQGRRSLTLRTDSSGNMVVTQGVTKITFSENGDVTLRGARGVRVQSSDYDFLDLKGGAAQLKGGAVVLEERTSSSDPAQISLSESGITIKKNGQELLEIMKDLMGALGDMMITTGGGAPLIGPLGAVPPSPVIKAKMEELELRLNSIGDF